MHRDRIASADLLRLIKEAPSCALSQPASREPTATARSR